MTLLTICEWLESTSLSILVRESLYGFPIVVAIHLLGLTLSVGTLVWFDLRLLGVGMRGIRVSELYRRLAPWLLSGFAVMFISGTILFAAFATSAYGNLYFRIKAAALVLASVNALIYHFATEHTLARWDDAARPPLRARIAGLTSIVVWAVVILAGRMMSYTMF
jgi:hypothetical protein